MTQSQENSTEMPGSGDWAAISALNLARMWAQPIQTMAGRAAEWPEVWAADPGAPSPFPNSATLLRPLEASEVAGVVQRLVEFYEAGQGGPWLVWSPWPTPELGEHGFQAIGRPPLMVRPAGGPLPQPPAELRIVEVHDDATMRDFERVLAFGYPVPEYQAPDAPRAYDARVLSEAFRFWVGYVDDEAVAISMALVDEQVVGIYLVATMPQMRGRGYGAALTVQATPAAPDLPAVLQASDFGRPVYLRLGFTIQGEYSLWVHRRGA